MWIVTFVFSICGGLRFLISVVCCLAGICTLNLEEVGKLGIQYLKIGNLKIDISTQL